MKETLATGKAIVVTRHLVGGHSKRGVVAGGIDTTSPQRLSPVLRQVPVPSSDWSMKAQDHANPREGKGVEQTPRPCRKSVLCRLSSRGSLGARRK